MKNLTITLYKPYEEIYMEPTDIMDNSSAAYCITTTPIRENTKGFMDRLEISFEDEQAPSIIGILLKEWILNNIYRVPYLTNWTEVDSLSRLIFQTVGLLRDEELFWKNSPMDIKQIKDSLIVALTIWVKHHRGNDALLLEFKDICRKHYLAELASGGNSKYLGISHTIK